MMRNRVGVVLQAAGLSSRMGKNKCLLPWKKQTVIETVADAFQHIQGPKIAVVGDAYENMSSLLTSKNFQLVHNERPDWGQSYSLRLGIIALEEICKKNLIDTEMKGESLLGTFCAVGDQPFLSCAVVDKIADYFISLKANSNIIRGEQVKDIVLPIFGNKGIPGNPVLFGAAWFEALKKLKGDVGGREILKQEGNAFLKLIKFNNELYGEDIDTPEKYQELITQWG